MSDTRHPQLWPPLSYIARELGESEDGRLEDDAHVEPSGLSLNSKALGVLQDAARRRETNSRHADRARPQPQAGHVFLVGRGERQLPVMLNFAGDGKMWHGWVVGADADWAGPFDVLLEADDEAMDPFCAIVQTWNRVTVRIDDSAAFCGAVSPSRLASIRAVSDERTAGISPDTGSSQPGRIGLRSTLGELTVLTGTTLQAVGDPRVDYQAVYERASVRLLESMKLSGIEVTKAAPPRTLNWISSLFGGGFMRPAFFALALAVVVQNVWLFNAGQDDIRFRNQQNQTTAAVPNVSVRWESGATAAAMLDVLTAANAVVVDGPTADGTYRLRAADPRKALQSLSKSRDVAEAHDILAPAK